MLAAKHRDEKEKKEKVKEESKVKEEPKAKEEPVVDTEPEIKEEVNKVVFIFSLYFLSFFLQIIFYETFSFSGA